MLEDYYNALILVKAGLLEREKLEDSRSLARYACMSLKFYLIKFQNLSLEHFDVASDARRVLVGGSVDNQTILAAVALACRKKITFKDALSYFLCASGVRADETRFEWLLKNNKIVTEDSLSVLKVNSARLGISLKRLLVLEKLLDESVLAAASETVDESMRKHTTYNELQDQFMQRLSRSTYAVSFVVAEETPRLASDAVNAPAMIGSPASQMVGSGVFLIN